MGQASGRFATSPAQAFAQSDALIAARLAACRAASARPIVAGLCGAQGSGKSTMAARLADRLEQVGLATTVLSLDDVYLTREERVRLGRDVHKLFATRGVPGTHDVDLARRTIAALVAGRETVALPRFDKTIDDRAPPDTWKRVAPPVAIVILEGWCVGARDVVDAELAAPINALERDEDPDGSWRRHVNAELRGRYRELFDRLDQRILLRAPDFAHVHAWRLEQEQKLARSGASLAAMDAAAITRFISHYERLTRAIMRDEPADLVIEIGSDRTPLAWRERTSPRERSATV